MAEDDLDEGWDPFADAGAALEAQRPDAAGKRPRGRPKGSLNRKTGQFEELYRSRGYRDPLVGMAEFVSADPVALQAWFAEHERTMTAIGKRTRLAVPSLLEIIKEQNALMSQLAPYLHGRKPLQVEVTDERLPVLVVDLGSNQLDEGRTIDGRRFLSVGEPLAVPGPAHSSKNKDLAEGDE